MVASQSASVVSTNGLPAPPTPALLTSTSSPPSALAAPSTTRRQPATCMRSPAAATARSPAFSSASALATDSGLLPFTATRAPAARNASTAARPIPRVPPVTRTLFPARFMANSVCYAPSLPACLPYIVIAGLDPAIPAEPYCAMLSRRTCGPPCTAVRDGRAVMSSFDAAEAAKRYAQQETEELIRIAFVESDGYLPEAVALAKEELQRRGVDSGVDARVEAVRQEEVVRQKEADMRLSLTLKILCVVLPIIVGAIVAVHQKGRGKGRASRQAWAFTGCGFLLRTAIVIGAIVAAQ